MGVEIPTQRDDQNILGQDWFWGALGEVYPWYFYVYTVYAAHRDPKQFPKSGTKAGYSVCLPGSGRKGGTGIAGLEDLRENESASPYAPPPRGFPRPNQPGFFILTPQHLCIQRSVDGHPWQ
jgi:hypothetical protein